MTQNESRDTQADPIGIDQLIALNDEIAALVRCGFPLGRGLLEAGRDLPGRLGRIAAALGARMDRGESLDQALAAERRAIPPLYGAVVEAGLRAGRLPAALEGLAGFVRGYADARRTIGLAMVYPVMVAVFAYSLFLGFVTVVLPRFVETLDGLGLVITTPVRWLGLIGDLAPYWWPIGPIALVALGFTWIRSGRASQFRGRNGSLVRLIPWSGAMLADFESANFTELLALLIEQRVPLPDALKLAGDASGDPRLMRDAGGLSEALRRGETLSEALARKDVAIAPLVRWVLVTEQNERSLIGALRNLASTYRSRANHRAEKLQIVLPIAMMFAFGAGATLLYGLALFVPLVSLLDGLGLR